VLDPRDAREPPQAYTRRCGSLPRHGALCEADHVESGRFSRIAFSQSPLMSIETAPIELHRSGRSKNTLQTSFGSPRAGLGRAGLHAPREDQGALGPASVNQALAAIDNFYRSFGTRPATQSVMSPPQPRSQMRAHSHYLRESRSSPFCTFPAYLGCTRLQEPESDRDQHDGRQRPDPRALRRHPSGGWQPAAAGHNRLGADARAAKPHPSSGDPRPRRPCRSVERGPGCACQRLCGPARCALVALIVADAGRGHHCAPVLGERYGSVDMRGRFLASTRRT
jgi:hypothetical protein